ncbi:lytic murein transglycosylase [uncultured Aquabacterium sp.]|uniref:lytic murein transglycosylase n=1 Tax=uncultured Aquabacterium sp. TaxID=158753 RepID=UPI00261D8CE9|nr:lytic murein transglycosylase [uncultured Aquabacterium sp.]
MRFPSLLPVRRLTVLAGAVLALVGCASRAPTGQAMPDPAPAPAPAPSVAEPNATPPVTPASAEQRFAEWVARFRESARAAGIDEATLSAAFDTVRLRPRAVEADRSQPEFTRTLWDYLDAAVSPQRVATGQQKLAELRTEAEAAAARHGVPAPVLTAVWGIESNYGRNYGDVPVVDALATLGFEGRREAWARAELMAALKILQNRDIDRAHMVGSWAGAMGQTQFMPSSFLAFAVDADGDGRRDIWGSMPDVLASTANFLARAGWRADEPWGAEVRLPEGFDPARADMTVRQGAAQWAAEGVQGVNGAALPDMADAAILLPAGVQGPAFHVGRNYRALLRYNNATSYALAVALLSQRIAGGPGVQAAWPREQRALTRSEIQALQTGLNRLGHDSGTPDGQFGPATRAALRAFQRREGLPADGHPTPDMLQRVQQAP